jgi:hypothetical protein
VVLIATGVLTAIALIGGIVIAMRAPAEATAPPTAKPLGTAFPVPPLPSGAGARTSARTPEVTNA